MKRIIIFISLVFALVSAAAPTQLSYTLGLNYVYNVTGLVNNNGYDTIQEEFVPGYLSTMNAIMVMQPIQENETAYYFVMNLFDTVVDVANISASATSSADSNSLGEDVYFIQDKTGQITEIQYYTDDPIYYVNVKVGAINAFQTMIVPVGSNKTVQESDPVGNHSTNIFASLASNGVLMLTKTYDAADFTAFPDPTLAPENMRINAKQINSIHPTGYSLGSTMTQAAILVNINDFSSGAAKAAAQPSFLPTNATGFDTFLSATGSLNVEFLETSDYSDFVFAEQRDGYISDDLFSFAKKANSFAQANALTVTIDEAAQMILENPKISLNYLTKVGKHLRRNPQETAKLMPLFKEAATDAFIRDRLFFVLTVAENQELIVKYGIQNSNCDIVLRAVLAAAHIKKPVSQLISALEDVANSNQCPNARGTARSILNAKVSPAAPSPFPFNKTYSANLNLGGPVAGVDLFADLFVGTNFNCKNSNFNYEGSAEVSATATLFGYKQDAFDAQIIYGVENGSPLADAITVSVWGNQVYNQPIPVVNCQAGTYPLYQVAPGFSVEHTLWVSIIPIVFSASANLELDVEWGWSVCPNSLNASIDVSGNGAVVLDGASYTDLILLRAGFEINGTFNADLTPTAYVQGTACEVGFEVNEQNTPMSAAITSYFEWKHCKYLFFDCQWGNYNQQTWWSWTAPAKDTVLYKATYQIAN